MKLGFMSSVCPKMTLPELIVVGEKHGYAGIEFRPEWDHGHGIELDASVEQRQAAKTTLEDSPLEGMCLSPGVKFCSEEQSERDAQLETLHRYIDLAVDTGLPRIRIFGDPLPNTGSARRTANYQAQAECLARAAERAGEAGVILVLETHMNFRGVDAGEVLFRAGYPPALRINWHLAHCLGHGEDVDESYRHVKGLVDHAHFHLSEDGAHDAHVRRQVELLCAQGFAGYFSLEVINPKDPEATLVRHAEAWRGFQ